MVGKTIHSKERALILKVLAFFEHEKEVSKYLIPVDPSRNANEVREVEKINKKIMIPTDQPINRTCVATGISKSTLLRIKKQVKALVGSSPPGASSSSIPRPSTPGKKRMQSKKKINLDKFDLVALRNLVNSFYLVKEEVPTLKKILDAAKTDLNFPGEMTTLRLILKNQLGFRFKKCKNARLVLIQRPDIAAWRARYLRLMKENKDLGPDKRPITYLNETSIQSQYPEKNCGQNNSDSKKNSNPSQRWILIHAGGDSGFVTGADLLCKCDNNSKHDELDTNTLVKWLVEKLIPNLPPTGIVVIDNTPYRSTLSEKVPTQSSLISTMQNWLTKNNIKYNEKMTKPELYHIILQNKPAKCNVVDELLKQHGHEVVRLPPCHYDLNPLEYIWNLIKQRIAEKNTDQTEDIEKNIKEAIQSISVEDWSKVVSHVQKLEQEYWFKDRLQETNERELIMSLGGESSESEREEYSDSSVSGKEELTDDESDYDS